MSQLATICPKTKEINPKARSSRLLLFSASAPIMMRAATLQAWTTKVKNTFLEFDEEDEPRYRRSSVFAAAHAEDLSGGSTRSISDRSGGPTRSFNLDPPVQSQLNPDAPEFDFTGVSGETQFGSESCVYLPLPEYTVQEWFDYLYYLQQTGFC